MALSGETVTLTGASRFALIEVLSDCVMTSVGTKLSPPPSENETASPGAINPISTPIAPASAARSTFKLTAQPPRSINATLPVGSAKYGASGLPGAMLPAGHP